MPLTPADVSNKRFSPVRLREGYDMGEVDQFLDEVESELTRLTRENDDLRSGVGGAQPGAAPEQDGSAQPDRAARSGKGVKAATTGGPVPPSAATVPAQTAKVASIGEASSAAARLLELATRNADQLVGEAKDEADSILGEARTKAERLQSESKDKADRVESDARNRAQLLESETAERRKQLFGDLDKEKQQLNGEVDNLRSFEREYRSRLKAYFAQQLAALDGSDAVDAGDAGGRLTEDDQPPSRLQSLLGKGEPQQRS